MRLSEEKIIVWDHVEQFANRLRQRGQRLISTNGCFDLIHLGHLNYLAQARQLGDCLWVGLNSDASVRRHKGAGRPIQDENTRALQLAALEAVDYVTLFEQDTPQEWLALVKPRVHVKGGDYRPQDLPEGKVVIDAGGEVRCLPFTSGFSTTDLINRIKSS